MMLQTKESIWGIFFEYEIQDCIALFSLRTAIDLKKKEKKTHATCSTNQMQN